MFPCHSVKDMEGYLKTDDRMRLAKERREEREKSLGKCVCSRLCMCGCSDSQGDFNLGGALIEVAFGLHYIVMVYSFVFLFFNARRSAMQIS